MTTTLTRSAAVPGSRAADPAYQAFLLLRTIFAAAPVLFGLDKALGLLGDWDRYLAPAVDRLVPGSTHTDMLLVGVVEVAAGLLVGFLPRIGAYVVAAWLAGIIANLLLLQSFYDVALRDAGLLVSALALGRLASSERVAS